MALRRIGDKPLSEPMLTRFTDAYKRHLGEMIFKHIGADINILQKKILISFFSMKIVVFYSNSVVICSQGSNWQCVRTGSDSGLMPVLR